MSTATQPLAIPRNGVLTLVQDYAELIKLRVTTLIIMTAWCGYYFGAAKSGVSSVSWGLFHALVGIGLIAAGTAALNEVMEHQIDGRMRRTANRPMPAGRMSLLHGTLAGTIMAVGGILYLGFALNSLTGWLGLGTSIIYLAAYTPLKRIHPICTFIGAYPGAMPGLDGNPRTSRVGCAGDVCHCVHLAVPALFFDCLAVSRRLRRWWHPHAASGGKRRQIDGPADSDLFDLVDSNQPVAYLAGNVWESLFCRGAVTESGFALFRSSFSNF